MTAYEDNRYLLMRAVEGIRTSPYVDTKGIATIGVGYNIQIPSHARKLMNLVWGQVSDLPVAERQAEMDFRDDVAAVLGKTYGASGTKSLTKALTKVLDGRTLALSGDEQAKILFADVAPGYEAILGKKLGTIADDNEHLSLFSLVYNSPALIGPGLKGALARDDHSEAWYEIRYGSNSDGVQAGRRYYESQIFGATNSDGHMTTDDARDLLVTRSRHIVQIRDYDAQYGSAIARANRNYSTNGNTLLAKIEKSDVVFGEAKKILIGEYGHGYALDEVIVDYARITNGKLASSEVNRLNTNDYVVNKGALMLGGAGNDVIAGSTKGDVLLGEAGNDALKGRGGNDYLDGGVGNDTMEGGKGDDVYVVDSGLDRVVELKDEGTDTVNSSVAFRLGDNVENLTLTGTQAIDGTGNSLDNLIVGNSGNNVLDGGAGADVLQGGKGDDTLIALGPDALFGGTGKDTFVITSPLAPLGSDNFAIATIADHKPGEVIDLKAYSGLPVVYAHVGDELTQDQLDILATGRSIYIAYGDVASDLHSPLAAAFAQQFGTSNLTFVTITNGTGGFDDPLTMIAIPGEAVALSDFLI